MLHLIFGRAGSGKTKFAREFFKENFNSSKKQILIVPEQYSFETEKAILEIMGEEKAQKINVMSFSRLCEWFFRLYGGLAGQRLSDGGRAVLMQLAIDSAIDNIEIYKKSAQKGELTELLLSMVSEMKMCAVSPEEMLSFAENTGDEQLIGKTKEISLILSLYDALVSQSYIDPLDELTKMDEMLKENDFFKDSFIVIDSFSGFTMQEMNIITHMLKRADEVYITLCCDNLSDESETGLFSTVRKTASKVILKARENSVKIAAPIYLNETHRFENDELKELEKYIFSWEYESFDKETDNIEVYKAQNLYDESEYVSSKIRELTLKENYRYRDIAVISRNPDSYIGILDVALNERNIAYFMDKPEDVLRKPLIRFVLGALQIVSDNYQSSDIFSYLKTGIAGLDSYEISLLENYTYIWKISGKRWFSTWKENPNGFSSAMKKEDENTLLKINELRERVITPLRNFEKAVLDANGAEIALAIFNLLEETKAQKHIENICKKFDLSNEPSKAQEQMRLWDIVMEVLDQITSVMGKQKADLKEFLRLFKIIFSTVSISEIPQGVDEVTIGGADRIRPSALKAVFIMGAVRGEFPKVPQNNSLFSLDERKELINAGMPIGRTFEESSAEEMLIAYLAACSSSCKVFFSYSQEGGAYPSEMISKVLKVFPKLTVKTKDTYKEEFFADTPESAFRLAAKKWRENSPKANALKALFEEKEEFKGKIEALKNAVSNDPIKISDKNVAMSMFGSGHRLSASQIETYHMCKFRYFCQYALRAKKIEPVDLSALEYGSLMHYLFEKIFFTYSSKEINDMSEKELRSKIEALTKEYSKLNYEAYDEKNKRFSVMIMRLSDSAYFLISHIAKELMQSRFVPDSFELEVGGNELPMNIPMPDGRTVSVVGKIDRVDVLKEENENYVRVVDYKTGRKEFDFSDLLYGLNLQMLLYLAALVENKKGSPAGVLYMPSKTSALSKDRNISEEELEKYVEGALRMNGIVLDDENIISAMEENCEGRFIPVKIGKNGKTSGSEYLVTREEFDIISKSIKEKIIDMTNTLQSGDVDALPLMTNKFGCNYCPYFAVCKKEFNEGDVEVSKLKHADVIRILRGGDENE